MEMQYGISTVWLDLLMVGFHFWLYYRFKIPDNIKYLDVSLAFFNFLLLRQVIIWTLPLFRFNTEITENSVHVILQLSFFYITQEFYMYFIHRGLHKYKFLYNNIHYVHHQLTADHFSSAFYMHPVEVILFIFGNLMIGPVLLHLYLGWIYKESMMIWMAIATFYFVWSHTGENDKDSYFPSTRHHFLHHKYFNVHFGSYITDTLFGTLKKE